jgi:hypothetical protein
MTGFEDVGVGVAFAIIEGCDVTGGSDLGASVSSAEGKGDTEGSGGMGFEGVGGSDGDDVSDGNNRGDFVSLEDGLGENEDAGDTG